jgi:hypothetical protein
LAVASPKGLGCDGQAIDSKQRLFYEESNT